MAIRSNECWMLAWASERARLSTPPNHGTQERRPRARLSAEVERKPNKSLFHKLCALSPPNTLRDGQTLLLLYTHKVKDNYPTPRRRAQHYPHAPHDAPNSDTVERLLLELS